jgi:acyl-homoserine lactone acylase PvdQ
VFDPRNYATIWWRSIACVLSVLLATGLAAAGGGGRVTVVRDLWGVPHVQGSSESAAAFGAGYAQAEDRLEDILFGYLAARGRAASVLGEEWLEPDLDARTARHIELARERYSELSPLLRGILEQFVAGIRAYMRDHPERVPAWGLVPEPIDPVARMRAFAWAWPWGQVRGELARAARPTEEPRGSNAFVVSRARSAEGAVLALIDPHLAWDALSRFHELHVDGGALHVFGFAIPGTPLPALGHTDVLSIAATTGGPDTGDVYEERIDPENPLRYEYDGAWRSVQVETVEIEVKTHDGMRRETRTIERTHHGPILRREAGRAWAARTAYDGEIAIVEQWMRLFLARDLDGFLAAMSQNQSLPQNLLYGDVHGETLYLRAGRVPRRPAGYDWARPVPGWTSATEWLGFHPVSDLVQLRDPETGFLQNCNGSPATVTTNSRLTAERYLPYLYNARTERTNDRGRRLLELLGGDPSITLDDARRFAADTFVVSASGWQRQLALAWSTIGSRPEELAPAVRLLAEWDGRVELDRVGPTLFRYWMRACRAEGSKVPADLASRERPPDGQESSALVRALEAAVDDMRRRFGRIDVPWGQVHRVERGTESWSAPGCSADGISTLFSVRAGAPDAQGVSKLEGGSLCTTIVLLRPGAVQSWSVTPYGQSDDPTSSHYTDQGRLLFHGARLKPTWFGGRGLRRHVESTRTWNVPPRSDILSPDLAWHAPLSPGSPRPGRSSS